MNSHLKQIVMLQTSDAVYYRPMLEAGRASNRAYCERHSLLYREYVGIKRGYYPWHACFNRIIMLKELIDEGFRGWAFYVDADAVVVDHEFDVRQLISQNQGWMIASAGGLTGERWDVNDGVFLLDLESERGREIAQEWYADFMATPNTDLEKAVEWQMVPSDQPRLHRLFKRRADLLEGLVHVPREILNNEAASFVQQVLRTNASSLEERIEMVRAKARAALGQNHNVTHQIGGMTVSSAQYGIDYASEFRRILSTYAPNAKSFLEWGAGFTTSMIVEHADRTGAESVVTIDSNKTYLDDVTAPFSSRPYLLAKAIGVDGPCINDRDKGLNYSTFPISCNRPFDFVFIDGRRRMECALVAAILSNADTVVVLHDYRRSRYQLVTALFRILEDGPQFRVMKLRSGLSDQITEMRAIIAERV